MKRRIWASVQDDVRWPAGRSKTPGSCCEFGAMTLGAMTLGAMTLGALALGGLRELAPLEALPPRPGPGPGPPFEEKPLPGRGVLVADEPAGDRATAVTASWTSGPISAALTLGAAATSAPAAGPLPWLPVA